MERSQRDLLSVLQSLFFLFISAASRTKKPGWDPGSCMSQDGRTSPAPVLEASSVGEGGVGWGMPSGSPPSILFLNSQVIIIIILKKKFGSSFWANPRTLPPPSLSPAAPLPPAWIPLESQRQHQPQQLQAGWEIPAWGERKKERKRERSRTADLALGSQGRTRTRKDQLRGIGGKKDAAPASLHSPVDLVLTHPSIYSPHHLSPLHPSTPHSIHLTTYPSNYIPTHSDLPTYVSIYSSTFLPTCLPP